jgi:uncharacterized protein YycO
MTASRTRVIRPEEAAIRRKAYELFLKYRRKGQVAKEMNAAGYRTRGGNIWRDTSILRILNESSAKGVYVFNTTCVLSPPSSLRFDAIAPKPKATADGERILTITVSVI